jgi:hypothetical protein
MKNLEIGQTYEDEVGKVFEIKKLTKNYVYLEEVIFDLAYEGQFLTCRVEIKQFGNFFKN